MPAVGVVDIHLECFAKVVVGVHRPWLVTSDDHHGGLLFQNNYISVGYLHCRVRLRDSGFDVVAQREMSAYKRRTESG